MMAACDWGGSRGRQLRSWGSLCAWASVRSHFLRGGLAGILGGMAARCIVAVCELGTLTLLYGGVLDVFVKDDEAMSRRGYTERD